MSSASLNSESLRSRWSAPTKKLSPVAPRLALFCIIRLMVAIGIRIAMTPMSFILGSKIGVARKLEGMPPAGAKAATSSNATCPGSVNPLALR